MQKIKTLASEGLWIEVLNDVAISQWILINYHTLRTIRRTRP